MYEHLCREDVVDGRLSAAVGVAIAGVAAEPVPWSMIGLCVPAVNQTSRGVSHVLMLAHCLDLMLWGAVDQLPTSVLTAVSLQFLVLLG